MGRLDAVGAGACSSGAQADALSQVVAGEFGFFGDRDTYDGPANADLIQVLDRRRGLPISLSILYVAAAHRIGWTANLLDVPGHVLVLIGEDAPPIVIDPFRGGVAVEREQVAAMMSATRRAGNGARRQLAAMPIARCWSGYSSTRWSARRRPATGGARSNSMTGMAPDYGHAWLECARLELTDGDVAAARGSLAAMLEVTRDPGLRERVAETLEVESPADCPRNSRQPAWRQLDAKD